jgi:hypothetical protein
MIKNKYFFVNIYKAQTLSLIKKISKRYWFIFGDSLYIAKT